MKSNKKSSSQSAGNSMVEVSLVAIYLGLQVSSTGIDRYRGALENALMRGGRASDRAGLIDKAQSGMTGSIIPFRRWHADIFMAASLMNEHGRSCFKGDGSVVDAGFFLQMGNELEYVDVVGKGSAAFEVLNPRRTRTLLQELSEWGMRPKAEVMDLVEGEFLKLHTGTNHFDSLKEVPLSRRVVSGRPVQAVISLFKVASHQCSTDADPLISRVARGGASVVPGASSLHLMGLTPEFLMEMHAAYLASNHQLDSLYVVVDMDGSIFLSPLPGLMDVGSRSEGWWVPLRDIGTALGGDVRVTASLPFDAALALMRHTHWMWTRDEKNWVHLAWCIQQQNLKKSDFLEKTT